MFAKISNMNFQNRRRAEKTKKTSNDNSSTDNGSNTANTGNNKEVKEEQATDQETDGKGGEETGGEGGEPDEETEGTQEVIPEHNEETRTADNLAENEPRHSAEEQHESSEGTAKNNDGETPGNNVAKPENKLPEETKQSRVERGKKRFATGVRIPENLHKNIMEQVQYNVDNDIKPTDYSRVVVERLNAAPFAEDEEYIVVINKEENKTKPVYRSLHLPTETHLNCMAEVSHNIKNGLFNDNLSAVVISRLVRTQFADPKKLIA